MPKKVAKRAKRKSQFDKGIEDFAEEMESFGKRFEKRGGEWGSWFQRTFGIIGPFISGVFNLLILVLVIWALRFINLQVGINLLASISAFLTMNIGLFFLIFLFFSYSSFFSRVYPKAYRYVSPIFSAAGVVIFLWILVRVIDIVSIYTGVDILSRMAFSIENNLNWIFWLVIFIGYLIFIIRSSSCCKGKGGRNFMAVKSSGGKVKRLYRSGQDKILGGVCGGIGEYLGVDPVLIRLLWVIAIFAWGSGILAYIIAWIIIPRNPRHKWG